MFPYTERKRHVSRAALLLGAFVGCTQAYMQEQGLAADNPDRVRVAVGVSADSAQAVAQSRAVRAGFIVSSSMPGLLTIAPYALKEDQGVQVTLRINFVADTAIVTGTVTDGLMVSMLGAANATNQRIVYASAGRNRRTWAELERLARAIQGLGED
jgi:hypothetical protein